MSETKSVLPAETAGTEITRFTTSTSPGSSRLITLASSARSPRAPLAFSR